MSRDLESYKTFMHKQEDTWFFSLSPEKKEGSKKLRQATNHYSKNQLIFQLEDQKDLIDEQNTNTTLINKVQHSPFFAIPFLENIEHFQRRCNDLKCNYVSQRRKDDLFKRLKKQQEERILRLKRQAQKTYTYTPSNALKISNGQITLKTAKSQQQMAITGSDLAKLDKQIDLNDTIVGIYLKFIQLKMLNQTVADQTHIFSSFLFEMLIGDKGKQEYKEIDSEEIQQIVETNFAKVKKWNKRVNVFEKKYLVFPINGWYHWNCVIVVNPNFLLQKKPGAYMVFCDSMSQKKQLIIQTIQNYLRCLIDQKFKEQIDVSDSNLPVYQLLLPRQTNAHDCGLYMLSFIEILLMKPSQIDCDMKAIENRIKLNLFPRTLAFSMRDRVRKLLDRLAQPGVTGKQMTSQKITKNKDKEYWKMLRNQWQSKLKMDLNRPASKLMSTITSRRGSLKSI